MTSEGSPYSPAPPSYGGEFNLTPPRRYSPISPATSPTYSPTYTSWPSPYSPTSPYPYSWTYEPSLPTMIHERSSSTLTSSSTPEQSSFLWGMHDGYSRLPHERAAFMRGDRLVTRSSIVDGTTSQGGGGEVINNANNGDNTKGVSIELNEVRIDGCSCPICYEACTSEGNHRICCLPCGHVYGLSCINKWFRFGQSSNKCPQCKRSCTVQDVKMLYMTRQHNDDHETSLKDICSRMEALELSVSALEQPAGGASKKLPSGLEQRIHALEESVHALEESVEASEESEHALEEIVHALEALLSIRTAR